MVPEVALVSPDAEIAERLSSIHGTCFSGSAHWKAAAFLRLGQPPQGAVISDLDQVSSVLALRFAADEGEVLTLAVAPPDRRSGLAEALLSCGARIAVAQGVSRLFLEVAIDNDPAKALYLKFGFCEIARRKGYYRRNSGARVDALVMELVL